MHFEWKDIQHFRQSELFTDTALTDKALSLDQLGKYHRPCRRIDATAQARRHERVGRVASSCGRSPAPDKNVAFPGAHYPRITLVMLRPILLATLAALSACSSSSGAIPPPAPPPAPVASQAKVEAPEAPPAYLDATQPVETRVEDLLKRLTVDEKISLIHADSKFTTPAIPRLGIPQRWMSDGPHGIREALGMHEWKPAGRTDDFATAMPVEAALAATWNPELAREYGAVLGQEARARGKDILLGPGVNLQRTPLNGRNFEYLGEDPLLSSRLVVPWIQGMQAEDTAACVKHFALNNQEVDRHTVNVEVDERPLRELYLPAFEAAVKEGGVLTVMGAYNLVRGQHACHNDYLLNTTLKQEWGFKGLVVTDWGGASDTRQAALNGLDLEMGTHQPYDQYYLAQPFRALLDRGEVPMTVLDEKVRRNLRVMFLTKVFDRRSSGSLNTPAHQEVARRVEEEAIVLLKNQEAILPLDSGHVKTLAIIGENATRLQAHGGGSAAIKALYEVTPLEGITRLVGAKTNIIFSQGYRTDGEDKDLANRAVAAAKQADVAVVIGGLNHDKFMDAESTDRKDLELPGGQADLIRRVAQANPRTVVVLISGAPVSMTPWLGKVPAVMQAWYGGMEGGTALAEVLFGKVNPSGKLPCTFPEKLTDSPAHALGAYPGKEGTERYEEGLLVGYRWFDAKHIEPLFSFGHGLSYTQFTYSNISLTEGKEAAGPLVTVRVDLTNSGIRTGAETVQVYINDVESSLPRPPKELKAFRKVTLAPGEQRTVEIPLTADAFAFYDPARKGWWAEAGEFRILVGSSSRDIRQKASFRLGTSRVVAR